MKIAFCGDSFCAEWGDPWRGYPAWTMLLLKEFNATAIQSGVSGDCLFHSYHTLLENIDDADYIIFCISEPHRLANRHNIPMNVSIAKGKEVTLDPRFTAPKAIREAARIYYKHLINLDFHKVAHKGILMQADQLILEKKKKCIWFPCFDTSLQEYKIVSGPCGTAPLMPIAERNNPLIPHSNHFSKEQNENMFTLLKNIIDKDAFEPSYIDLDTI